MKVVTLFEIDNLDIMMSTSRYMFISQTGPIDFISKQRGKNINNHSYSLSSIYKESENEKHVRKAGRYRPVRNST